MGHRNGFWLIAKRDLADCSLVHCDALAANGKGITQVSCFESCIKLAVAPQVGVTDEAEKTRIEEYFKTIQVSDGRWDWTMWCQSEIVWAPGFAA
jgi:hypothetical protein